MAGGNLYELYELWIRFVEAKYLVEVNESKSKCPTCNSTRDCNNYYCLVCRVGGLCPKTFRTDGAHSRHPWLQVRRQSHRSAVNPKDLEKFIIPESVKHIQKCSLNASSLCYLRASATPDAINHSEATSSKSPAKPLGSPSTVRKCVRKCEACNKSIANSQECKEKFLLCSVQCLIRLAQRHPERNLLRMPEGALAPIDVYPETSQEKIMKGLGQASRRGKTQLTKDDDRSESRSDDMDEDGDDNDRVAAREAPPFRASARLSTRRPNYLETDSPAPSDSNGRPSAPSNDRETEPSHARLRRRARLSDLNTDPLAPNASSGRQSAPPNDGETDPTRGAPPNHGETDPGSSDFRGRPSVPVNSREAEPAPAVNSRPHSDRVNSRQIGSPWSFGATARRTRHSRARPAVPNVAQAAPPNAAGLPNAAVPAPHNAPPAPSIAAPPAPPAERYVRMDILAEVARFIEYWPR